MFELIDNYLDKITMYRLTLYGLIILLLFGSFFNGIAILFSAGFILITAYLFNSLFSDTFEVKTNTESFLITSLILALIISPPKSLSELLFMFWVTVLAISSKFIFTFKRKHIFNPVAIAVVLTSVFIGSSASWWIGSVHMLIPTAIVGLLIIRKLRREDLFISFIITTLTLSVLINFFNGFPIDTLFLRILKETPLIFFATIMLTEPLTLPPTKKLKIIYGILAGILFTPQLRIFSLALTPEMALIISNIFSFIVSFKERIIFRLKEKIEIGADIYDFILEPNSKFSFTPGQYMEFTLPQKKIDSRGMRRYFSLASSPTEYYLRLGVKFNELPSSFKKSLLEMNTGDIITASNIDGDFTLPNNRNIKLAFLAGGIGITPFRSIFKDLIDTYEKRDIVLIYSNKNESEIVYKDIFEKASQEFDTKIFYVNTSIDGHVTDQTIKNNIPDWKERTFYISGPHGMVVAFEDTLKNMGVKKNKIVVDYFPGF